MDKDSEKSLIALGKRLKVAREEAGLSQVKLAKMAGLGANYYATVERGERNISYEKLQKILKVLKIKTLDIS